MRVSVLTAGAILVCATARLTAHDGPATVWTAPGSLSPWDLVVIAGLTLTGALYARGAWILDGRGVTPRWIPRLAFAGGWLAMLVAIVPPLDDLVLERFSWHMVQHELMMLVGAPLLVAGRPLATVLWGLPERWRLGAGHMAAMPRLRQVTRWLTAPALAWVVHAAVIWGWHAPRLYDAAVGDESVHALQHAMFAGSAAMFWWGLLAGRYGRAGYGAAVFYVFTTAMHTGLLGAMLTFARVPLYSSYAAPAAARAIDPLTDQQLAGLLMWIPAGLILLSVGVALLAAWLGEAERRTAADLRAAGRGRG